MNNAINNRIRKLEGRVPSAEKPLVLDIQFVGPNGEVVSTLAIGGGPNGEDIWEGREGNER